MIIESGSPPLPVQVERRMRWAAASIGQTVTLIGTGFTAGRNTVQIGDGYVVNLSAPDSSSLRFTLPDHLDPCPPDTQACVAVILPLLPGSYKVWVTNAHGTSNAATLEVTRK
jgi:hypothetical protein